jgi:predicted lipoprotein with Yx(FWY)xxD motif
MKSEREDTLDRKLKSAAALILAGLFALPPALAAAGPLPAGLTTRKSDDGLALALSGGEPLYRLDLDRYAKRRRDAARVGAERCANVCDKLWRPVPAPKGLKAEGDWTTTERPWGAQLTYKGDPLYSFAGTDLAEAKEAPVAPPYFSSYTAKPVTMVEGVPVATLYWHAALYQPPAPEVQTPAGVSVRWTKTAYVFADSDHRELYVAKSGRACQDDCDGLQPLTAPLAAAPLGEWKPVEDAAGGRYWAYRGRIAHHAASADVKPPGDGWRPLEAR